MNACFACHGTYGEALSGAAPDLRRKQPPNVEYLKTVLDGALAANGMPPIPVSEADTQALYAYLVKIAWEGYEAQEEIEKKPSTQCQFREAHHFEAGDTLVMPTGFTGIW